MLATIVQDGLLTSSADIFDAIVKRSSMSALYQLTRSFRRCRTDLSNFMRKWQRKIPKSIWEYRCVVLGSVVAASAALVAYSRNHRKKTTFSEVSSFKHATPVNKVMNDVEKELGCVKPPVRVKVHNTETWNIIEGNVRSKATSVEQLFSCIANNLVEIILCQVDGLDIETRRVHGLGICSSLVLVNRHLFGRGSKFRGVYRRSNGRDVEFATSVTTWQDLGKDRVVFAISTNFSDITHHFPSKRLKFSRADGFINKEGVVVGFDNIKVSAETNYHDLFTIANAYSYKWANHGPGMCGVPLVVVLQNAFYIAGIHCGGSDGIGFAIPTLSTELKDIKVGVLSEGDMNLEVQMPHVKSMINYREISNAIIVGKIGKTVINNKSRLKISPLSPVSQFLQQTFDFKADEYGIPMMRPTGTGETYKDPYGITMDKISKYRKAMDPDLLRFCVDQFVDEVLTSIGKRHLSPYDLDTALNGCIDDAYCRRINLSTAAGFGYPGNKRQYVFNPEDEESKYTPNDDIVAECLRIIDCYRRGEKSNTIMTTALKDEPRLIEKCESGATRMFYIATFPYLAVSRMFLGPIYSMMIEKGESFKTAIGVDMFRDAEGIRSRLLDFSELIVEGDYSGYDVSMPADVGIAAMEFTVRLLSAWGYNAEQQQIVRGIMSDALFPKIVIAGDLYTIQGLQPSGKYGTAEDNSIRNVLLMMYTWYKCGFTTNFFKMNVPLTYGDDFLIATREKTFTCTRFAEVASSEIGLKVTTSSKGDVDEDFIDPKDMSFLKRSFVFSKALDRYVAPLSLSSICRSMEWYTPAQATSEIDQLASSANSALLELIFHVDDDRDLYESIRISMLECLKEGTELRTYDDSLAILKLDENTGDCKQAESEAAVDFLEHADPRKVLAVMVVEDGIIIYLLASTKREIYLNKFLTELSERSAHINSSLTDENLDPYKDGTMEAARVTSTGEQIHVLELLGEKKSINLTLDILRRRYPILWSADFTDVKSEADTEVKVAEPQMMEVMTDNANPTHDEKTGTAMDLDVGNEELAMMQKFLARPVKLTTTTIPMGVPLNFTSNIWDAWTSAPSVRAKLRNYAYLRGDLKVRISISGTPFNYGKILVSYQPMAGFNANIGIIDPFLGTANRSAALTYLSQAEGSVVMDISDNEPLEITCGYVNTQPLIRLFNASPLVLADTVAYSDTVGLGKLYIVSINSPQSASATPTDISMIVQVWMENAELGTTTGTVIQITSEADERKTGPVQRMASRMADVAGYLSHVPVISRFASASKLVLDGIVGLASIFGFSYPTMNNEPARMAPMPYQNGANVIGYDTGKRITLDPQQELSIDPRATGTVYDEMSLSCLCQTTTYLDTFEWDITDPAMGSAIWTVPVNPAIAKRIPQGAPTPYLVAPTALGFAAKSFEYWRGDITFIIEVVASKYHRGKLAIIFEPNISQNVVIDTILDTNKQYIQIMDISNCTTMSFTVKWAFPKAWAKVLPDSLLGDLGDVAFLGPSLFDYANGYIAVVPYTALQSQDGSPVSVNVYIESTNMQFNQITDINLPNVRPASSEAGVYVPNADLSVALNKSTATTVGISSIHFGETPVSFRSLLKRFVAQGDALEYVTTGTEIAVRYTGDIYPPIYPPFTGVAVTGTKSLYGYLRPAYLGMRGGMKKRVSFFGDTNVPVSARTKVNLLTPEATSGSSVGAIAATVVGATASNSRLTGTVDFCLHTNAGVEFELPLYTNNMYGLACSDDPFPAANTNIDPVLSRRYQVLTPTNGASGSLFLQESFAAAEDFSFMRFLGAPLYEFS